VEQTLGVVLAALGLAGLAGAAFAVFRSRSTRDTIDLLEQSLRIERTERVEHERRCAEQIAHLQGRVDVLTNGLADALASRVVAHIRDRLDGGR
jgi:hypothetical protein